MAATVRAPTAPCQVSADGPPVVAQQWCGDDATTGVAAPVLGVRGRRAGVDRPPLARPALAQPVPRLSDLDLSRLFAALPDLFEHVFQRGSAEFFRLLEDFEVLHIESEIDRYVGQPRELNDSTAFKLRLLPYSIEYPISGRSSIR